MIEYRGGGDRESPPSSLPLSSHSPSLDWPYLVMLLWPQQQEEREWGKDGQIVLFSPLFVFSG